MAGTVPTKGMENRARSAGSTSVDAVLQAMTTRSGAMRRDQPLHDGADAGDQRRLVEPAIGEGRVVGGVDIARIGPKPRDFTETVSPPRPKSKTRIVGARMVRIAPPS